MNSDKDKEGSKDGQSNPSPDTKRKQDKSWADNITGKGPLRSIQIFGGPSKSEWEAMQNKQREINRAKKISSFKEGVTVVFNDGRTGHQNVKGTILSVSNDAMVVQFEDRAEPNTIRFDEKDWMDHLSVSIQ